uniref:Uncharacterized protein n=1 Tax=Arundo donax TaxID=35708 RepID=A0A0A9BVT5_ARUDO
MLHTKQLFNDAQRFHLSNLNLAYFEFPTWS